MYGKKVSGKQDRRYNLADSNHVYHLESDVMLIGTKQNGGQDSSVCPRRVKISLKWTNCIENIGRGIQCRRPKLVAENKLLGIQTLSRINVLKKQIRQHMDQS